MLGVKVVDFFIKCSPLLSSSKFFSKLLSADYHVVFIYLNSGCTTVALRLGVYLDEGILLGEFLLAVYFLLLW